jgi:hypothetical protein
MLLNLDASRGDLGLDLDIFLSTDAKPSQNPYGTRKNKQKPYKTLTVKLDEMFWEGMGL